MRIIILAGTEVKHTNGSTLRLHSLKKYFTKTGHTVDTEHFMPRGRIFPLQYGYLLGAKHRGEVKKLINDYDLVVVASSNLSILHPLISQKGAVLDVCDSLFSVLKFKKRNDSFGTFLRSLVSTFFLGYFIRKFDALSYITAEDSQQDSFITKSSKSVVIRNSANLLLLNVPPTKGENQPLVAAFIADLQYSMNLIQYEFILKNLYHSIVEFGFVLHLYGNRPKDLFIPKEIRHFGYVPDVLDVYKQIDISLCPDFQGFGFKNKVQESLMAARPVLTTPLGARGQRKMQGLIIDETSIAMIDSLKSLSNREYLRDLSINMKEENRHFLDSDEDSSWLAVIRK